MKSCTAQIKALSALEKAVQRAERNDDVEIFDGPEFRYAFFRIVGMFKKAIQQVSGSNSQTWIQRIMKEFGDEVRINERDLRRRTAEFHSSSVKGSWTDCI